MNRITLLLAFVFAALLETQAQYFVSKVTQRDSDLSTDSYVVDNNGDTIYGKLISTSWMNTELRSFKIKTDQGKIKYDVNNAKLLAVKPYEDPFEEDSGDISIRDLRRALDSNFNKIVIEDWVFFERIQLPKKKEKYAFIQLLNPGFDSKVKIYRHDGANKTMALDIGGINVSGDDDASHLVVTNGGKARVIKKRKYKEWALEELFDNCELIKAIKDSGDLKWRDLAKHVYIYDQKCP